jgi:hypothetical protein
MVKTLRDEGLTAAIVSPALYIGGWGCACNHEVWAHQAEVFPPPTIHTKWQAPRYHGADKSHALQPATYCYAFVCLRCNKYCFSRFRLATSWFSLTINRARSRTWLVRPPYGTAPTRCCRVHRGVDMRAAYRAGGGVGDA